MNAATTTPVETTASVLADPMADLIKQINEAHQEVRLGAPGNAQLKLACCCCRLKRLSAMAALRNGLQRTAPCPNVPRNSTCKWRGSFQIRKTLRISHSPILWRCSDLQSCRR